jgi:hypothetical protein
MDGALTGVYFIRDSQSYTNREGGLHAQDRVFATDNRLLQREVRQYASRDCVHG